MTAPRFSPALYGFARAALVGAASFLPSVANADCLSLISGPIVYDVEGCATLDPEHFFDPAKPKYQWVGGLDAVGKKQLFDSYRGLYLKGKVVKSDAVNRGLSTEKGALNGDIISGFIPPSKMTCAEVSNKRLNVQLKETCCDGGGEVPCMLGTGYLFATVNILGSGGSEAGDNLRGKAKASKDARAGDTAMAAKKYRDAAKAYEKAKTSGDLDVKGHYNLGLAYREMDECNNAILPLKYVFDQHAKKQVWADEESVARKATFLLARCYSKMNEPSQAVLILQGYLLEADKYRSEIQESLKHKDFGWIHTSKEYREYKKEAEKKLRTTTHIAPTEK